MLVDTSWHAFQLLCIYYDGRNSGKVIAKYLFYNVDTFPKFYLNQTSITIKNEKNLIREKANEVFQNFDR